ncbi:MAG: rhomboid family intramembrane serine protease [Ignavibacteriales bacterium]|nr:MAG: rhomboid family intramembrane serine protease [Ignavibacteriales bacterium]
MLFPIGDDNREIRITPFINYLFILINLFVFIFLQKFGSNERFTYAYSTVPAEILTGNDYVSEDKIYIDEYSGERFQVTGLQSTPVFVYLTIFTSMFMHGSFGHLLGNLLFLWVFGDNIENRLGHLRYLIFYLLTGVLASLSHVFVSLIFDSNLFIPSLGASGAISGVLGGYILLYPRKRVTALLFYFVTAVPAVILIGLWFVFQLINGLGMLGGDTGGGVAYAAHIGGFIAGLVFVKLFDKGSIYHH